MKNAMCVLWNGEGGDGRVGIKWRIFQCKHLKNYEILSKNCPLI